MVRVITASEIGRNMISLKICGIAAVGVLAFMLTVGCSAKQPPKTLPSIITSSSVSLGDLILPLTSHCKVSGNQTYAEGYEHAIKGMSLDYTTSAMATKLSGAGWKELRINVDNWKILATRDKKIGARHLGYGKNGLYYTVFLFKGTGAKIDINHSIKRQLGARTANLFILDKPKTSQGK